jgi:predicted RNA binding protein YcfA (HicA-like mRNA interferase family)
VRQLSGKELARIVERNGWKLLQIHSSHYIYGKPGSIVRLSIPVHENRPLKRGLLAHLMKLAELNEGDLEK